MAGKKADDVLASVAEFARPDYGVDVFKLESPVEAKEVPGVGGEGWERTQALFDEMGRLAGRPWVMLSDGAGMNAFQKILTHAYRAGASGYLAGRAIWQDAFAAFPDWVKIRAGLEGGAVDYMRDINALTDAEAASWHTHPCFGPDGARFRPDDASFRHGYSGFSGSLS